MIGIELCQEAVEDAKVNAQLNGKPAENMKLRVLVKVLIRTWFVPEGLTNVEFHCGKAEDLFPNRINAVASNVTAIVDPPRAGLRESETLKRVLCLLLISMNCRFQGDPCHQESGAPEETGICGLQRQGCHEQLHRVSQIQLIEALSPIRSSKLREFISSLCRAPSNRVHGPPFQPVRAMAVDLFPQTIHTEMLLLLERVDYSSQEQQPSSTQEESLVTEPAVISGITSTAACVTAEGQPVHLA